MEENYEYRKPPKRIGRIKSDRWRYSRWQAAMKAGFYNDEAISYSKSDIRLSDYRVKQTFFERQIMVKQFRKEYMIASKLSLKEDKKGTKEEREIWNRTWAKAWDKAVERAADDAETNPQHYTYSEFMTKVFERYPRNR